MVGAGSLAIAPLLDPVAHAELPNREPNKHFRIKEVPESARKPIANQASRTAIASRCYRWTLRSAMLRRSSPLTSDLNGSASPAPAEERSD